MPKFSALNANSNRPQGKRSAPGGSKPWRARIQGNQAPAAPRPRIAAAPAAPARAAAPGGRSRATFLDSVITRGHESADRDIGKYGHMMMDPFNREAATRYPDETILPTSLVHLTSSSTYLVDGTGTMWAWLKGKVISNTAALGYPAAYTLIRPTRVGTPWGPDDYGSLQASWQALESIDRTLAYGIRVRVTGLAPSSFLPSGSFYFLQIQQDEAQAAFGALSASGEEYAIQAVTAGKGFSMTTNELSKMDGVTLPGLPQGPMSFLFSDKDAVMTNTAGNAPTLGTAPSQVSSACPILIVVGFGLQAGMVIRVDYAHHVEYVPSVDASGLVQTKVCAPSAQAREGIASVAAIVQQRLGGSTSGAEARDALSSVGKALTSMVPGGNLMLQGASAAVTGLGGPQWLKSALASLA